MTASHFDPIFPAHAIERCTATVAFSQGLPQKLLSATQDRHKQRLLAAGFSEGPKAVGLQFDVLSGRVIPLAGGGPMTFVSEDQGTTIIVAANQISVQTLLYTRWANFETFISKYVSAIFADFTDALSISATKLEYWDRFIWTGDWDDFDVSQLLAVNSDLISARAAHATRQWHSHAGWFENPAPARQRLVNANVDVVSVNSPNFVGEKPSVGIYTSLQDSDVRAPSGSSPAPFTLDEVPHALRQQHLDLKALLGAIISPGMAKRIGL